MREWTDPLTPDQVYRFAVDPCQPHVDFQLDSAGDNPVDT